ncbi:hypothetical protein [Streptomyces gobiensis]|uniref:hypothetical protein n=1 Tax=Streptomyces gobiensis TaxID=2875706 RepID=UPI001E479079|nr:hypothetical protein [Streptomyces gobiensis]UGY90789.1 hypothetical protein test1122_02985 [Streptomyces gobiensis]
MKREISRDEAAALLRERLREADECIEVPPGLWDRVRTAPDAVAGPVTARRSWFRPRLVVAGVGLLVMVAVGAVSAGAWWLVGPGSAPDPASGPRAVVLTVHNAEVPCRPLRTQECALRLARDPYAVYAGSGNAAGKVWHRDRLSAECVVTDGTLVRDESGMTSTRWYRVTTGDGVRGWLPGVRTRNTAEVRECAEDEVPGALTP